MYEDIQDSISTTDNTSTYEERIRQISEDWETKYNDLDDYWRTKYTSRFFTTPDEVVDRHEEDTKSEEEFVSLMNYSMKRRVYKCQKHQQKLI